MKKIFYEEIESTNKTAKELNEAYSVIITHIQTGGYGKYDRPFYSPEGGLYMSITLPIDRTPSEFTMTAAVAVCRAIESVCKKSPKIKWVNDIILNNKKVGGILTESCGENAIIGIGLNVFTKEFPPALPHAGAISDEDVRVSLSNEIIEHIENPQNIYDEYKSRIMLIGKQVRVSLANETFEATVLDLDIEARLIVKRNDGACLHLVAGEVERIL